MALAMDTFLTIDEIAKKLRVSRNTIVQAINNGQLLATRVGRQYRIKEVDYVDFVNRNYSQQKSEEQK